MPGVYDLIQSVLDMQQNAQAAVPVIPNNGNPAGAHNMPHPANVSKPAMPAAKPDAASFYPWLKPSASMDAVKQMLSAPIKASDGDGRVGIGNEPRVPIPHKPDMGFGNEPRVPILPQPLPNVRQEARANGDFYTMPKRGQRFGVEQESGISQLPVVPRRMY